GSRAATSPRITRVVVVFASAALLATPAHRNAARHGTMRFIAISPVQWRSRLMRYDPALSSFVRFPLRDADAKGEQRHRQRHREYPAPAKPRVENAACRDAGRAAGIVKERVEGVRLAAIARQVPIERADGRRMDGEEAGAKTDEADDQDRYRDNYGEEEGDGEQQCAADHHRAIAPAVAELPGERARHEARDIDEVQR